MRTVRKGLRRPGAPALALAAALALGAGCDGDGIFETVSEDKLAPPLGLGSITGNGEVTLTWFTSNFEDAFEGYIVFMDEGDRSTRNSTTLPAGFNEVDRIELNSSNEPQDVTITGLTNGTTYSFAVVAFRQGGDEISRTSNIVADTPRPDITNVTLTSASTNDVTGNDLTAGFDFDDFMVESVPADLAGANYTNTNGADVVHEAFDPGTSNTNIRSWLAGMNGGGVQDLGYMTDLDGSDVAPEQGYAGNGESVLLTVGHVYAVRTGNANYGKLIVTSIEGAPTFRITFNAAFQTKQGDPNYLRALGVEKE